MGTSKVLGGTGLVGVPGEAKPPFFLYDFVDVARPFEALKDLWRGNGRCLGPLASAAGQDGEALLLRIGPSWAAGHLSRAVRVTLGACRERGRGLAAAIRWEEAELPALFPVLDGDLELTPLGPDQCRLILSASYLPPLGELGRRLDRALLHRVAESTVRSFLLRLAASLEAGQELA
jgi:hypothetical protein